MTHRVALEEFPALYGAFDKRVGGVEKVFVETQFSSLPSAGAPVLGRVADWYGGPEHRAFKQDGYP